MGDILLTGTLAPNGNFKIARIQDIEGGSAGSNTWPLGTPWSTIGPLITGTFGTLDVEPDPSGATRHITTGTWDLSGIRFVAPSYTVIEFDADAALDATSGSVALSTNGVGILGNGALVPSGTLVMLSVAGNLHNQGATTMFPEVADGSSVSVQPAFNNGSISVSSSGNVATVADASSLIVTTARSTTIYGGSFSGPVSGTGYITFTADNESQSRVGNGAFGTAVVTVTQVNGFLQLRRADGSVGIALPVMPSATTSQAVKLWDGADPAKIVGITVTPAADGGLTEIVEDYGILTQFTSDGTLAISCDQILNYSSTHVGYVTPVGSSTDGGKFATVSRSTCAATPGALVQGCFVNPHGSNGTGAFTPIATKTANYAANDYELVPCDPTAGGFTVTLPAASTAHAVIVKNKSASANTITVAAAGMDLIDGSPTYALVTLPGYGAITLYSDLSSSWMVI